MHLCPFVLEGLRCKVEALVIDTSLLSYFSSFVFYLSIHFFFFLLTISFYYFSFFSYTSYLPFLWKSHLSYYFSLLLSWQFSFFVYIGTYMYGIRHYSYLSNLRSVASFNDQSIFVALRKIKCSGISVVTYHRYSISFNNLTNIIFCFMHIFFWFSNFFIKTFH